MDFGKSGSWKLKLVDRIWGGHILEVCETCHTLKDLDERNVVVDMMVLDSGS